MAGDDEILRIAAQFDVGSITAGMDEAAATVNAGTAKMNDSFSSLAAAQIRVATANKDLRDTLTSTVSKGLTPTVSATEEVAAAMFEAKVATDAFKAAQAEAYGATERTTGGVNNARVAFTGLTQDLGIRGSRAVGSFISQSETLGPILQRAFAAIAVIAFIEILDQANKKLGDMTDSIAGFGKAAQATYQQMLDANQRAIVSSIELSAQIRSLNTIGVKDDSKFDTEKSNRAQEIQETANALKEANNERSRQLDLMQHLRNAADFWHDPLYGLTDAARNLSDGEAALKRYERTVEELEAKLKQLKFVEEPKTNKEQSAFDTDKAQKYAETLAKMSDEDSALTQRDAEKDLREYEKVMNERERMEEELEKTTLDLAKKDLESFQHNIIEKTRMQEQFGRDEIEQIKAAAEAQSKSTQAHSFAGAADPALIQIADRSLDEQAFKIMDLIALEEKLRATLQQTGIAESDPKIQESLGRQQQLVQQLAVAMQKYDQAVQKASDDQSRKFIQSFDAITGKVNSSILSWVNGTESFGKAMEKVWIGLADTAIESLLKIAEQELIGMLLHKTIADTQKLDDAKTAAAGAYAATSSIPIVGPVLAPAAAAAAFAAVLAFEKGGIMPNSEGLALLHPREMVLPSNISESVQRMASGGAASGGRGFGPMHVHVNVSGSPSASDLKSIEGHIVSSVKRARRAGRF